MTHLSPQFIEEMKKQLLADRARLQAELSGLSAHTELGSGPDDNADEVAIDEVNQDIISRLNADLKKIDKALLKIENGTYGIDDDGHNISEERLRALPWADKAI